MVLEPAWELGKEVTGVSFKHVAHVGINQGLEFSYENMRPRERAFTFASLHMRCRSNGVASVPGEPGTASDCSA